MRQQQGPHTWLSPHKVMSHLCPCEEHLSHRRTRQTAFNGERKSTVLSFEYKMGMKTVLLNYYFCDQKKNPAASRRLHNCSKNSREIMISFLPVVEVDELRKNLYTCFYENLFKWLYLRKVCLFRDINVSQDFSN